MNDPVTTFTHGKKYLVQNSDGTTYYGCAYEGAPMIYKGQSFGQTARFERHDVPESIYVPRALIKDGVVLVRPY